MILWEAAGASDVGRRRRGNEDAFFLDPARGIFMVADGMGGHAAGEVASRLVVQTVTRELAAAVDAELEPDELGTRLGRAFARARDELIRCCDDDPSTEGMGTTLTTCILSRDGLLQIGHIGDSRAYRVRRGELELLTSDHTWVQREIAQGRLPPDAAESHPLSHILTRVLSADLPPEPDILAGTVVPGDLLLLTSDGLHGLVPPGEMRAIVTSEDPLPRMLSHLIDEANRHGGRDNITGVLVRILPNDSGVF